MTVLEPDLSCFKELAKQEFGLDFYNKNELQLLKAINTRSKIHGYEKYQSYYRYLINNREELLELVCLLTNNETYFYREPKQLEFLCEFLIPNIRTENSVMEPIRILSIGCSIGAEPYSIAMALEQKFGNSSKQMFNILAADVDSRALKTATAGRYRSMEFRSISAQLQQQYFTQEVSGDFILAPEIRDMVSFHHWNVVSDSVADELKNIDIVFFRNVSIYFDMPTRQAIQKKIINLLKPTGYLLVGMTESMSNDFGLLKLKNHGSVFYFAKGGLNVTANQNDTQSIEPKNNTEQLKLNGFKEQDLAVLDKKNQINETSECLLTEGNSHKAAELLAKLTNDSAGTSKYFLLKSFILLNRRDYEHARDFALRVLEMEPFNVEGFLLLGMISKCREHFDDAVDWFKKALFIHADCWPAHFHLADLYRRLHRYQNAAEEYRLVLQQLQSPNENYIENLNIPLSFNCADIQMLCRSRLNTIQPLN